MTTRLRKPLVPWSIWIWAVHGLFVFVMWRYMYIHAKPEWFKQTFSALSLGHEENYAVWWSGICLFIGSQLFYRVAVHARDNREVLAWAFLSVGLLSLAYDEMGSLHEMVSKVGGWQALVPFGVVFMAGFGYALVLLFARPGYRLAATMILLGLGIFGSVASLEFVEHNISMDRSTQRLRLIVEESIELFAMSLFIIAGLLCLKEKGVGNRRLSEVIGNPRASYRHGLFTFSLFALQFFLIAAVAIPNAGQFSEGNPAAVYPVIQFFALFLVCYRLAGREGPAWIFAPLGLVFLFTSLCQMHGFVALLNKLEMGVTAFTLDRDIWLVTLVPLALSWGAALATGRTRLTTLAPDLVLFAGIAILLGPDNDRPMIYHLFSGAVAYLCYRALVSWQSDNLAQSEGSSNRS